MKTSIVKNSRSLATLTLAASLVSSMAFARTVTGSSSDATANGGNGGRGGRGGNATAINNFNITYIEISNSGPIEIISSGPTEINSSGPTNIVSSGPTDISNSGLGIGGLSFITTVTGGAGGAGGVGGNGGSATAGGGLDPNVVLASVGEGINTLGNGGVGGGGGTGILAGGVGDILTVTGVSGAGGDPVTLASVPEPASLALLGTGVVGLGLMRRRKAAG